MTELKHDLKYQIGLIMRRLRLMNDYSIAYIVEKMKISKSYYSELESGKKKLNIDLLEKFCTIFDISVSDLFLLYDYFINHGILKQNYIKILVHELRSKY